VETAEAAQSCNYGTLGKFLQTDDAFNPNQGTFSWEFIHEELDCLGSRVSAAVEAAFDMGFLILWTLESRKINPTNRTFRKVA
jgi:hypothetical protein